MDSKGHSLSVQELVEVAYTLDRRIKKDAARLEDCKEQLRAAARAHAKPGVKIEGQTVELAGGKGNIVRVEFPRASLIRTGFWLQGEEAWIYRDNKKLCLGNVVKLAGDSFNRIFRRLFKPKGTQDEFRQLCKEELNEARAEKILEMFTELPAARVSFEPAPAKLKE